MNAAAAVWEQIRAAHASGIGRHSLQLRALGLAADVCDAALLGRHTLRLAGAVALGLATDMRDVAVLGYTWAQAGRALQRGREQAAAAAHGVERFAAPDIALLLLCGLRRFELDGLTVGDVQPDHRETSGGAP